MKFVLKGEARISRAATRRIAPLDHEVGDDPMEDNSIIEWFVVLDRSASVFPVFGTLGQSNKVGNSFGCLVREEFTSQIAGRGMNEGHWIFGSGCRWLSGRSACLLCASRWRLAGCLA